MLAEILREPAYGLYRLRLNTLLQIPEEASELEIHALIEVGFAATRLMKLFEDGDVSTIERDQIIPLRTLKTRVAKNQNLTVDESDRLFRAAHITAMADAVFGNDEKAKRWLSKPKERFSGSSPMAMLSTVQGTRQVEEALIQMAEGFSF
ncbi:antitoxin Xre/MbcA/ParS toxin-binding domain-containing protein [Pseudomonas sp. LB3P31]